MQAVRDLELPNEDIKILERMCAQIWDEQAADQLRPTQQAFVRGGDIMHDVCGMHEAFHHAINKRTLMMFLLLDCTKGFNNTCHSWMWRVLEKA